MTVWTPDRFLVGGTPRSVIVPARVARAIWREISSRHDYAELCRATSRTDPEAAAVLIAIGQAGIEWTISVASGDGQAETVPTEAMPPSNHDEIDAAAAADILGCSPRNIGHLRASGRLVGRKLAGRWMYAPEAVAALRTTGAG